MLQIQLATSQAQDCETTMTTSLKTVSDITPQTPPTPEVLGGATSQAPHIQECEEVKKS